MNWTYSGRPGYDLHDALTWCCKQHPGCNYLEVGVDGGGFLETVLREGEPLMAILFDMWDGHAGHGFTSFAHIEAITRKHRHTFFRTIEGDSKKTLPSFAAEEEGAMGFDLINIDGGHDFETALSDLTHSWPLLRPGCFLVLDDAGHASYPDVKAALDLFLKGVTNCEIIPEAGGVLRNCVVLQKVRP